MQTKENMQYFIKTFGCQMNEHDSEIIAGILDSAGYQPASDISAADVIIINNGTYEQLEEQVKKNIG